ncbi:unnamed protein product [Alopecurus aequalis]
MTTMAFLVAVPVSTPPILRRLHLTTTRASAARTHPLPEELQLVADVRSPHNHIRVADVSPRAAGHPLAGARLLLLDGPGNIHSVSFPRCPLTQTYLDVFAALPPLLPRPSIAVLGFGAGSAARALLHFYPDLSVHGWELDPFVIAVARDFFGLDKLEKSHADRLVVHVGDALEAEAVPGGFGGVLVDLFANGSVLPELQEAATWRRIGEMVARGGTVLVNCGGGCVEAEEGRDGEAVKDATLRAMAAAFGEGMVATMEVDESWVAMTGPAVCAPEGAAVAWKARLPPQLRQYVDLWRPYNGNK